MILVTTPQNFEQFTPAISNFHGGTYFPRNGSLRQIVNGVVQAVPTTAIDMNSGEELTLRVTDYNGTAPNGSTINDEKEKIGWALWIEGDDKYVIINNRTSTAEATIDFTNETDAVLYYNNLRTHAYIESEQGLEDISSNNIPDTKNELIIKFSKWLDGKTIFIEAFRNNPNHNESMVNSPAMEINIQAATPEITKVYWEENISANITQEISTATFNQTINLCIETLRVTDQDFEVEIRENNNDFYPLWHLLLYEQRTITLNSRKTIITFNLRSIHEFYTDLNFPNEWIEELNLEVNLTSLAPTPVPTPTTDNPYINLIVTAQQRITTTYFARRLEHTNNNTITYTFEKIEKAHLLEEVYLVAECSYLDGETINFQVFNEQSGASIVANNTTAISLFSIDAQDISTESTTFPAVVANGFAYTKIKFRNRNNDTTFTNWMNLLFGTTPTSTVMDFIDAKIFINAQTSTITKTYNGSNNLFTLKAAVVVYNIYHTNARITKTNIKKPVKAKYIYHDKNNFAHAHNHFICDIIYTDSMQSHNPQDLTSVPIGYDVSKTKNYWGADDLWQDDEGDCQKSYYYNNGNVVSDGRVYGIKRYRRNGDNTIPLLEMPTETVNTDKVGLDYSHTDTNITPNFTTLIKFYYKNTQRRYCKPDFFAGFIGVLGKLNYTDIACTGMAFKDATAYPSVSHPDGLSVDTAYLYLKNTTPNQTLVLRQQNIINAFKKFYFTQRIKGSNATFNNLDNSTSNNSLHDDHLHCGKFDYRAIEIISI